MPEGPNEIVSTADLAEQAWDGNGEPGEVRSDIVATHGAEGRGIEFHVSMRDYTARDMEELIVEAAAQIIVGRRNESAVTKAVEARCVELLTERADAVLSRVTAEVLDQPMTPSFGGRTPVTMREFLGLYGREYLTEKVDNSGKVSTDSYYRTQPRIQYLVEQAMGRQFKADIEKATNAAIVEIRAAIKADHEALLAAEKSRLRAAIAKTVEA